MLRIENALQPIREDFAGKGLPLTLAWAFNRGACLIESTTRSPPNRLSFFQHQTLHCHHLRQNPTLQGRKNHMAKKKEKKKKERERRVAQEKHAAAEKRNQEKSTEGTSKAARKTNIFTAALSVPKSDALASSNSKKMRLNYRRSGGGG